MEADMIRTLINSLRQATPGEAIAAFTIVFAGAFIISLAGG